MNSYEHLVPDVRDAMRLSREERIRYIRMDRWVEYDRAREILTKLEDLIDYPSVERPPNLLIVARTNNGKTRLINHFLALHPADPNPGGETIAVPVLLVSAPEKPDLPALHEAILSKLFIPFRSSHSPRQKYRQVVETLTRIGPGLIAIDEINNLLAGPVTAQKQVLNGIKILGSAIRRPIVGLGTEDALRVTQSDPQVSNRFEPEFLPRWQPNADFQKLLMSLERMIPLANPSLLAAPALARIIHQMSEGTIGELSKLINDAAIWAIDKGTERIDETALTKCGYRPPSKRKTPTVPV